MRGMLKTMADLINPEEEEGADRVVAFNADEISSSVRSEELAGVDVAKGVDLRVHSSFDDPA